MRTPPKPHTPKLSNKLTKREKLAAMFLVASVPNYYRDEGYSMGIDALITDAFLIADKFLETSNKK